MPFIPLNNSYYSRIIPLIPYQTWTMTTCTAASTMLPNNLAKPSRTAADDGWIRSETSDGFPLFSCCHSEPTSLVSESVEDAMILVVFDDEEEAEFCPEDTAATGFTTLCSFFTQFNHPRGCHVSACNF